MASDDLRGGNERAGEGSAEQEAAGVVGRREGAEWKASGVGGAGRVCDECDDCQQDGVIL